MLHESLAGSQLHMWANSDTYMGLIEILGKFEKRFGDSKIRAPEQPFTIYHPAVQ